MSIWSSLKRGLGATGEPTRAEYPIFEHLEPRLLLSADPVGLASLVSLDDGEFESAIVVDFERLEEAEDQRLSTDEDVLQTPEDLGPTDEFAQVESGVSGVKLSDLTLLSSTLETTEQPVAPGDASPMTDNRLPVTDTVIDSYIQDSIQPRGPPADTQYDSSHSESLTYTSIDDLTISTSGEGEPSDLTLRLNGEELEIIDTLTGKLLANKPLGETSEVIIHGVDDLNDTLTIDFNGGIIEVPITFHGGDAGFDTLILEGGQFSRAVYGASGPDAGWITLDNVVIYYFGLEPVVDLTTNDDRIFNITTTGVDQNIRILDAGGGQTTIKSDDASPGFESLTFLNPADTLTINTGDGNDTIIIETLDLAFAATITINGQTGDDTLVIQDGVAVPITFNGGSGTDAVVNENGAAVGLSTDSVETFIDRPLLFIPGFGGTGTATLTPAGFEEWLLNRGISPDKLALEPFAHSYSDIVQSFVNVGYRDGTNLPGVNGTIYTVLWDYRVNVADTNDGVDDGELSDVTAANIQDGMTDGTYDSALDYLAYWLEKSTTSWQALTGNKPATVDVLTHSTGGIIAKAYIQSLAYGANADLPRINNLVQSAVPNQGTGATYSLRTNNFNLKAETHLAGLVFDKVYDLILGGETLNNPDGSTITSANIPTRDAFVGQYIETLTDLLAVYAFLDDSEDGTDNPQILTEANGGNGLLFDLNANSPDDFVSGVDGDVDIVFAQELDTADIAVKHTGSITALGLKNLITPFDLLLGRLPTSGEVWYETTNAPSQGDTTVSAFSATNGFDGGLLTEITQANSGASDPVSHIGLVTNSFAQRKTIEFFTGTDYGDSLMSTDLELGKKDSILIFLQIGLLDPVELALRAFDEVAALTTDIEGRISAKFDQSLPLVNKSVNELLNDPIDGVAVNLFDAIGNAAQTVAGAVSLDALEEAIEDAIGLPDPQGTPDFDNTEFDIDFVDGVLDLGFAFDLTASPTFRTPDFWEV